MRKTIIILVIVTLLGIAAAYELPAGGKTTTSTSTSSSSKPQTTSGTTPSQTTQSPSASTGQYKDGTYTGSTSSNMYEDIQVAITVSGGKITNITTPVVNSDSGHSQEINSFALPQLTQEAISAQNAQIDSISGASYTSQSYVESLQSALDQAKA